MEIKELEKWIEKEISKENEKEMDNADNKYYINVYVVTYKRYRLRVYITTFPLLSNL